MHPLNRKMFQQPIKAQSGVYVPTIEQILNFYQGGFNEAGQPTDTESFLRAIEATKLMNKEGLFPGDDGGDPLKFMFTPKISDREGILNVANQTGFPGVQSVGFGNVAPDGTAYQSIIDQGTAEQVAGIMAAAASDPSQRQPGVIDSLLREGAEGSDIDSSFNTGEKARRDAALDMLDEDIVNLAGKPAMPEDATEQYLILEGLKREYKEDQAEKGELTLTEKLVEQKNDIAMMFGLVDTEKLKIAANEAGKNTNEFIVDAAESIVLAVDGAKQIGGEAVTTVGGTVAEFFKGLVSDNEEFSELVDGAGMVLGIDTRQKSDRQPNLAETGEDPKGPFGLPKIDQLISEEDETKIDDAKDFLGNAFNKILTTADDILISKTADDDDFSNIPPELLQQKSNVFDNVVEKIGPFETKIKDATTETKELVTEGLNKIKEVGTKLQEVSPKTFDVMEKEINSLTEKVKNNKINTKEFNESLAQIKDNIIELTADLGGEVKDGVIDVVDNLKDTITGLTSTESTKSSTYVDPNKRVAEPITEKELEKFKVNTGDGGKVVVDDPAAVTGTITSDDEVKNLEDSANQVADGSDTKSADGNVLATAGTTTGELGSGQMNDVISKALAASGYQLDQMKDPNTDALKMIYYGTLLATTPGEFKDAAMENLNRFVKDEINAKYKSAAQKQKFRGDLFKVVLAGEYDLLKAQIAAGGKTTSLKAGFLPSAKDQTSAIQSAMVNGYGIDVDIDDDDTTSPTNDFLSIVKSKTATKMSNARTAGDNLSYSDAVNATIEEVLPLFTTERNDNEGALRKFGKVLTPKFAEDFLFGKNPKETSTITGRLTGTDPATIQAVIQAVKDQTGRTINQEEAIKLISEYQ